MLRNCHDTLKPYSSTLVELIEADSDDYAEIVSTLCQNELMVCIYIFKTFISTKILFFLKTFLYLLHIAGKETNKE